MNNVIILGRTWAQYESNAEQSGNQSTIMCDADIGKRTFLIVNVKHIDFLLETITDYMKNEINIGLSFNSRKFIMT